MFERFLYGLEYQFAFAVFESGWDLKELFLLFVTFAFAFASAFTFKGAVVALSFFLLHAWFAPVAWFLASAHVGTEVRGSGASRRSGGGGFCTTILCLGQSESLVR